MPTLVPGPVRSVFRGGVRADGLETGVGSTNRKRRVIEFSIVPSRGERTKGGFMGIDANL